MYRASTSWGLFVAIIITSVYYILSKKQSLHKLAILLITMLVLWQTRDLNQWFYNEYIKYQKDLKVAYQLAEDIEKNSNNLNKPIVFIGDFEKDFYAINTPIGSQSNGLSVLWWGKDAFEENGTELIKFIDSLGYNFRIPTDAQCEEASKLSKEMNTYPKEGYIKEFEDFIVVKISEE